MFALISADPNRAVIYGVGHSPKNVLDFVLTDRKDLTVADVRIVPCTDAAYQLLSMVRAVDLNYRNSNGPDHFVLNLRIDQARGVFHRADI